MKRFFFSADGRLNRARFWLGQIGISGLVLVAMVVAGILVAVPQAIDGGKNPTMTNVCACLAFVAVVATFALGYWSYVCLGIKRYHDRGRPGVWVLIQFVPFVGGIWYFVEAFCLPGTYGANPYGADRLNPGVGSVEAARLAAGSPATTDRPGWVVPMLLAPAGFGVLLALAAVVMAAHTTSWLAAATKIEGRVVELKAAGRSADDGSHEMYRAVVEARTREGAPIRIIDMWATYPAPEVGSTRTLAYPVGRPNEAIVAGFMNLWFLPTLLGAIGGINAMVWLLVALLVKLFWKRRRPEATGPVPRLDTTMV